MIAKTRTFLAMHADHDPDQIYLTLYLCSACKQFRCLRCNKWLSSMQRVLTHVASKHKHTDGEFYLHIIVIYKKNYKVNTQSTFLFVVRGFGDASYRQTLQNSG